MKDICTLQAKVIFKLLYRFDVSCQFVRVLWSFWVTMLWLLRGRPFFMLCELLDEWVLTRCMWRLKKPLKEVMHTSQRYLFYFNVKDIKRNTM